MEMIAAISSDARLKSPILEELALRECWGLPLLNDTFLRANSVPDFSESVEVLEIQGVWLLKGKRYVSGMDKKCPPRQIIGRGG